MNLNKNNLFPLKDKNKYFKAKNVPIAKNRHNNRYLSVTINNAASIHILLVI